MKQNQFAVVGALIGGICGYPLSYFFQPGALRAKVSLGQYIEHFSDIMGAKDLQSTVVVSLIIAVVVGAVIGFVLGRSADQKT
ncbi:MAG: hypothetical protein QOJ64_2145 [Acidobacteriota bacterium]|jgi:membrane protein DedA with SNARE-associated domain|nr:hypothetical protein [Acidobacteriota bacterium]